MFPTQIRVIGTGAVSTMGALIVTAASFIIDSSIHAGFPVMIIFAVLSALSMVIFWKMPETYGCPLPDIIEELKQQIS